MSSSLTNYFTRAIELTHMYTPHVTRQERLEAEQYLMTLRATAEGLNLSFHIISNEPVHDFRCFWAFNTVMHHLPSLACSVDDAQAGELYRALFSFIYRYFFSSLTVQRQTMDFLGNKHAQMMVAGLQEFFPSRWQSFFDDAFELFARRQSLPHVSDAVTVYLLRLFEYIDERVVSVRANSDRCREMRARDMEVKDAMREHVMGRAVATWYDILCDCRVRSPEIANICLSVVQTYIEWVDVALFMTADWINLLYFFVTVPALRTAACECIFSLVEKKQLPAVKLESLRTLNIVDALPRIVGLLQVPPRTDEDVSFLEVVARLTRAVAEQFLTLYEHMLANNSQLCPHPLGNVGNERGSDGGDGGFGQCDGRTIVGAINSHDMSGGRETQMWADGCFSEDCLRGLFSAFDSVVTHFLRLLSINHDDVSSSLLPFVQTYAKSAVLREERAAELLLTLYDQTRIPDLAENEDQIWLDDTINKRKQIHSLIRLIFSRYPSLVYQHLQAVIGRVTATTGTGGGGEACGNGHGDAEHGRGPQHAANAGHTGGDGARNQDAGEMEAALRYLYEIGESFRMDRLRDAGNEFSQFVGAVLSSERIAGCPFAVVHLSYFEVLDRYHAFFIYHKECIPLLLQRFLLLPCGVTSQHCRVRARICYLFGHFVQLLKTNLLPHRESIVNALHAIFSSGMLLPSDRRELYEAAGGLLSIALPTSAGGVDDKTMIVQVIESLAQSFRNVSSSPAVGDSACSEAVADSISFLSALAKGLRGGGGAGSGVADAVAAEMFHRITCDVMHALVSWHASASVRDSAAQYFTQMVHTLPFESMEVYFAAYITRWLAWMETTPELTKLLRLLLQFVHRSGPRVASVLSDTLPPVVRRVAAVGELFFSPAEAGVVSESTREAREVHRQLFGVLLGAAQADCAAAVVSLPPDDLSALLARLLAAVYQPAETELPRVALQIMAKITAACSDAGWLLFMLDRAVPAILERLTLPAFEARDARNFLLVGEAGLLLRALVDRVGPGDPSLLRATNFAAAGEAEARGLLAALQAGRCLSADAKSRLCRVLQAVRERRAA